MARKGVAGGFVETKIRFRGVVTTKMSILTVPTHAEPARLMPALIQKGNGICGEIMIKKDPALGSAKELTSARFVARRLV